MERANCERGCIVKKVAIFLIILDVIGMALTAKSFFTREKVDSELNFSADRFEHVVIEGGRGNVQILPSTSSDIEVIWKGSLFNRGSRDDIVWVEENDSELKINIGKQRRFFNISFFDFDFLNRLEVRVYMPEKQFNSLVVKSEVGNVNVKDVQVDYLTAETDVANMTIESVHTKSMVVETNVGNVMLENIEGKLHAESDVGNITIRNELITNDMTLLSDVGKIELTVPRIPDNITFDADSSIGNVKVFGDRGSYISSEAEHIVSMYTDIGNITVRAQR